MANKQYIGARYVPKFYEGSNGNEWDSGVSYEPLTVVTYLNDSYTSKKPVPNTVGNPAHNSEYWAHTGAYNAQVEEYRQDVLLVKENFINTSALGMATNGNVTNKLQQIINDYSGHKIYVPKGNYEISNTITIPNGTILVCDSEAKFYTNNSLDIMFLLGNSISLAKFGIVGGFFDATNVTDCVIKVADTTYSAIITDVHIDNVATCGIKICSDNSTSSQVFLQNITIIGKRNVVATGTGIIVNGTDNYFNIVNIGRLKIGIKFNGSGNIGSNIHVWNDGSIDMPTSKAALAGFRSIENSGNNRIVNLHIDGGYRCIYLTAYNTYFDVTNVVFNYGDGTSLREQAIVGNDACMLYYTTDAQSQRKSSYNIRGVDIEMPVDSTLFVRSVIASELVTGSSSIVYNQNDKAFDVKMQNTILSNLPIYDYINNVMLGHQMQILSANLDVQSTTNYYLIGYILNQKGCAKIRFTDRLKGLVDVYISVDSSDNISVAQSTPIRFGNNIKICFADSPVQLNDGNSYFPVYVKYGNTGYDYNGLYANSLGGTLHGFYVGRSVELDDDTSITSFSGTTVDCYTYEPIKEVEHTLENSVTLSAGGYSLVTSILMSDDIDNVYKPVTVLGVHSDNGNVDCEVYSVVGTACTIKLRNNSNEAQTVTKIYTYVGYELK